MADQLTPLEAARRRGQNLRQENPLFDSYSPLPNVMYRIILAAVLNTQEAILERLDGLEHRMDTFVIEMSAPVEMHLTDKTGIVYDIKDEQIPFSEPPLGELPEPAVGRVNKPCKCGEMMLNVHPATKYCDKCKGMK